MDCSFAVLCWYLLFVPWFLLCSEVTLSCITMSLCMDLMYLNVF